MAKQIKKSKEKLEYFINLFKVEGHGTWRISVHAKAGDFERLLGIDGTKKPVITDKKILIVDRVTGDIKEQR